MIYGTILQESIVMYGVSVTYKDAVGYVFNSESAMATIFCK